MSQNKVIVKQRGYRSLNDPRLWSTLMLMILVTLFIFSFVKIPVISSIHFYTLGMLFGQFSFVFYVAAFFWLGAVIFNQKTLFSSYFRLNRYSLIFVILGFVFTTAIWSRYRENFGFYEFGTDAWKDIFNDWWNRFFQPNANDYNNIWYPESVMGGVVGAFLSALFSSGLTLLGAGIAGIFWVLMGISFIFYGHPFKLYLAIFFGIFLQKKKIMKGSKEENEIEQRLQNAEQEYVRRTHELIKSKTITVNPNENLTKQTASIAQAILDTKIIAKTISIATESDSESATVSQELSGIAGITGLAGIQNLDNVPSVTEAVSISLKTKQIQLETKEEPPIEEFKKEETIQKTLQTPVEVSTTIENLPFDNPLNTSEIQKSQKYFISAEILNTSKNEKTTDSMKEAIRKNGNILNELFKNFKIDAHVVDAIIGPTLTKYIVKPGPSVNLKKIAGIEDNIKMALAATGIRMELPIPGKAFIGIECPNPIKRMVTFKEVFSRLNGPQCEDYNLPAALGLLIDGKPLLVDISKTPHFLIAGATGSGKSVGVNSILISLIMKMSPWEVNFILIDPKMVEFTPYDNIKHLHSPIITDPETAAAALKDVVELMEKRYRLMAENRVRKFEEWNALAKRKKSLEPWPYLVVVIDELADLMNVAKKMVETAIQRITQKARAAGIHLIVATQRPSVDVVTGVIKANIPSRIAFTVTSSVDSKVILDSVGAETLMGQGDLLISLYGQNVERAQGAFLSNEEIEKVTYLVKGRGPFFQSHFGKKSSEDEDL